MRSNAKLVIKRITDKLNKAKKEVPKILANEGQKHFNQQFRSQSFEGDKWDQVQRKIQGTFAYKYPKNKFTSRRTNPILVGKTRRLKNALNRSVKSANPTRIIWGVYGSEGMYGYYHNFGIGQKRRSFMRASNMLKKKLKFKFSQIYKSNIK